MKNFSKLFGAIGGTVVGQGLGDPIAALLTGPMTPEHAQAVGKIVELLLPIIGTYIAPANQAQQPVNPAA